MVFFSSLSSVLHASEEFIATKSISGRIKELLVCQSKDYSDRIKVSRAFTIEN